MLYTVSNVNAKLMQVEHCIVTVRPGSEYDVSRRRVVNVTQDSAKIEWISILALRCVDHASPSCVIF